MHHILRRLAPVLLLCAVAGAGTSGCIYRMAIQQGNFLDAAQVAQLEAGMTRSQVAFLLGTPMIPNGFDRDRWDYFYYLKDRRNHPADERRVTVVRRGAPQTTASSRRRPLPSWVTRAGTWRMPSRVVSRPCWS